MPFSTEAAATGVQQLSFLRVNSLGMAWLALLCPTVLPPVAVTTTGHFILGRKEREEEPEEGGYTHTRATFSH